MSNVATVQKLARHEAFMTHSVEKRLGDIFSLSHSSRDSEERRGGLQKLNLYTAVLNWLMCACLTGTKSALFFSLLLTVMASTLSLYHSRHLCLESMNVD